MKIIKLHDNGQLLMAHKTYEELSQEEKENLHLASGEKIENYELFRVDYNKRGKLTLVVGQEFTKEYSKKIQESSRAFNDLLRAVNNKKVDPKMAWSTFLNNK